MHIFSNSIKFPQSGFLIKDETGFYKNKVFYKFTQLAQCHRGWIWGQWKDEQGSLRRKQGHLRQREMAKPTLAWVQIFSGARKKTVTSPHHPILKCFYYSVLYVARSMARPSTSKAEAEGLWIWGQFWLWDYLQNPNKQQNRKRFIEMMKFVCSFRNQKLVQR